MSAESISEYVRMFYDLQAEATKEIMRMSFFLNYGGIAATLAAFASSAFQSMKGPIIICLVVFVLGLALSVFMALEYRNYAYFAYTKAIDPATTENSLKTAVLKHRGKGTIKILCISSLILFGIGIIIGLTILFNLYCALGPNQ